MLICATGVFEILHPGHLSYLEKSKALGDKLIVIVASDSTANRMSKNTIIKQDQRLRMVSSLKIVDEAILGGTGEDIFSTIVDINPDILTIGPDQKFNESDLEKEFLNRGLKIRVVRIADYWNRGLHSSEDIKKCLK